MVYFTLGIVCARRRAVKPGGHFEKASALKIEARFLLPVGGADAREWWRGRRRLGREADQRQGETPYGLLDPAKGREALGRFDLAIVSIYVT
jgi:hypothetical protein